MTRLMNKVCSVSTCILTALILQVAQSYAQDCDTNQAVGYSVERDNGYTTTVHSPGTIGARYRFVMISDSGRTLYDFTELKHNNARIRLKYWCNMAVWGSLTPGGLIDSSRSEEFIIHSGDSINFYRELGWFNPLDSLRQRPHNYHSHDTLSYAVELVKATSGQRLALLDSFTVLRQIPSGYPTFFGSRPIMARVAYSNDLVQSTDTVFVRVTPYARGPGLYNFVREDQLSVAQSDRLTDTTYTSYLNSFGKRSIRDLQAPRLNRYTGISLDVTPQPSHGPANISFSIPESGGKSAVVIYDANGNALFFPFINENTHGTHNVQFEFEQSGVFYVALYFNETLVHSKQVTVIK